jgi:hypothetical protein
MAICAGAVTLIISGITLWMHVAHFPLKTMLTDQAFLYQGRGRHCISRRAES